MSLPFEIYMYFSYIYIIVLYWLNFHKSSNFNIFESMTLKITFSYLEFNKTYTILKLKKHFPVIFLQYQHFLLQAMCVCVNECLFAKL